MKVSAKDVSAELMKLLRDKGEYAVHSCFQSGFNIKVNEFLCFIGNRQNTKLPFGILLEEQPIPSLLELLYDRKVSFVWNEELMQFETDDIIVELRKANYFSSFIKLQPHGFSRCYLDLLMDNIDLNLKTGFEISLSQLLKEESERKERLYSSFKSKEKSSIRPALLKWIGYGLGLTPSGDDFLVGILFANTIYTILSKEFLQELKELVREEKYTTDISTHYYISAFESCYNDALIEMYEALITFNEELVRISIDKILQFGHTSGCDMIAGILMGLIYGVENYKLT